MCVLQLIIAPVPTIEACKKRSAEIQKFENLRTGYQCRAGRWSESSGATTEEEIHGREGKGRRCWLEDGIVSIKCRTLEIQI